MSFIFSYVYICVFLIERVDYKYFNKELSDREYNLVSTFKI